MKCIKYLPRAAKVGLNVDEVYRVSNERADEEVSAGYAQYTAKKHWKAQTK